MSIIDVDKLLQAISSDAACGEDLEYDPTFQEMLRGTEGKPERQMGDSISPAEEPDWAEVRKLALSLFSRTKDLRVALYLTTALLHSQGFAGLRDGVLLIKGLLERYWETLYPELDADDNNDPTERVNALLGLCDRETLLHAVRTTPIVSSKVLGSFSLRDVEIASGTAPAPPKSDPSPADMTTINAAFLDSDIDELRQTMAAVEDILTNTRSIEATITERIGTAQAPDLSPLTHLVGKAQQLLHARLDERDSRDPGTQATPNTTPGDERGPDATTERGASSARPTGDVSSREDVVRLLDTICQYYASYEPSSPVPMLLQRARRLVTKDFVEIVRDLAPDAMKKIEEIRGPQSEKT